MQTSATPPAADQLANLVNGLLYLRAPVAKDVELCWAAQRVGVELLRNVDMLYPTAANLAERWPRAREEPNEFVLRDLRRLEAQTVERICVHLKHVLSLFDGWEIEHLDGKPNRFRLSTPAEVKQALTILVGHPQFEVVARRLLSLDPVFRAPHWFYFETLQKLDAPLFELESDVKGLLETLAPAARS